MSVAGAAADSLEEASAPHPRSRLFRKYALLFGTLVAAALIASGGIEVWFSYQESKAALLRIQHEKAVAAAAAIERFVRAVESQVAWTTNAAFTASAGSLARRRIDYRRLLRQAPAVTEIRYLDAAGREQVLVSRLALDVVGSNKDYAAEPEFRESRAKGRYLGPVYFRKESEPYMTLALAGRGRDRGVTVAYVNLKFIWDVVSRIRAGRMGRAFVVDSQGLLIAHPDISLVLRKTDLSALPQVTAARSTIGPVVDEAGMVARGLGGREVLSAHAQIRPLGWLVFVESPISEAFQPLYNSLWRTALLLVAGIALSALAGLVVARRMVRPIQVLAAGAAELGKGNLAQRIEIETGDELEDLAGQFNRMGAQLQESYATLERKVDERTRELSEALEHQTTTSEILHRIASMPDEPQQALDAIAETAARMFGASSVGIRRVEGNVLSSVCAAGPSADTMRKAFPEVPLDRSHVLGRCAVENRQIHVENSGGSDLSDDGRISNRLRDLPAQSSAFTPFSRSGEVIGAMSVYRDLRPFDAKELEMMKSFADQAVIAIENARLLGELRERTDTLAQREAELRVTFDNMGDGVVMFDKELRLAAWNGNLKQLLGVTDQFFAEPRRHGDFIAYLSERGEFVNDDPSVDAGRYGEDATRQDRYERTRPDGRVLDVRRNPVTGGGFVLIYSDITERKRAEEEVRAARDAAEKALAELKATQANLIQAQKMASLGELTAGIAHEIKNPLNFVNNFTGLSVELLSELKESTAPAVAMLDQNKRGEIDEVFEMLVGNLDRIAEHGSRADGIVKSMLAHSRGSSGDRQSVDINALIEESLNLAYHGARAQDQNFNITLERDFDRSIAPLEVAPQDITRVFLNLFGNGFYAANKRQRDSDDPEFRPVLKVTTRDVGEGVLIAVRDNGVGMAAEVRDRLFEPFFTTKPTGEGTGLGLSISYDIVTQQHGGTIEVASQVGEFTEFTIRLPRRFGAAVTTTVAEGGRE
jgi:signal transduction histidine kinase